MKAQWARRAKTMFSVRAEERLWQLIHFDQVRDRRLEFSTARYEMVSANWIHNNGRVSCPSSIEKVLFCQYVDVHLAGGFQWREDEVHSGPP